ncbi:hypothetical protein A2_00390 [Pseudomonas phage BIM BV-45]|nr:hypothetical protein A2_00390 [Pseudomonas phage BIM BV-45]
MADYLSINEFPGNGAIMQIEVQFAGNNPDVGSGAVPYFKPEDVKAQFFTPATDTAPQIVEDKPLGYVGPNTFITLEPVPTGKILRVYRETEDRFSLVNFVALQNVTERDLDALARQTVFLVEEAKDAAQFAIDTAREAIQYATASTSVAREALEASARAEAKADAAVGTANGASGVANQALVNANKAQTAAEAAEQHATNVETLASQAQTAASAAETKATRAETKADQAIGTANAIDGKATQAINTANQATATANSAKSTAEAIEGKANQAIATANSATQVADDAKATAEAIDGKATTALANANTAIGTANQANVTAADAKDLATQANSNVAGKVNRTGDTLTGQLVGPSFQTLGAGGAASGPRFEMHWPGQSAGMWYLNNSGQITLAQTGGQGIAAQDYLSINMSDGYMLHRKNGRFMGTLAADGGMWTNTWNPASGGTLNAAASLQVANGVTDLSGVFRTRAPTAAANAHIFFENPNGTERVLMFADNAHNLNIRTSAGPVCFTVKNADKGIMVTGPSNFANTLYVTGRIQGGQDSLVQSRVYADGGGSWLGDSGNVYGGVWGGYLSNWIPANVVTLAAFRARSAEYFSANQIGSYCFLQNVSGTNIGQNGLLDAGNLRLSSHNNVQQVAPEGTWRCLGWCNNGGMSVWIRVY